MANIANSIYEKVYYSPTNYYIREKRVDELGRTIFNQGVSETNKEYLYWLSLGKTPNEIAYTPPIDNRTAEQKREEAYRLQTDYIATKILNLQLEYSLISDEDRKTKITEEISTLQKDFTEKKKAIQELYK